MMLGERSTSRDNNLNLIRAIAATAVLVSHAYPIALGPGTPEPLRATVGYSLGSLSVLVFFAISGFLIAQSFLRTSSWQSFAAARVLRLMPGLIVSLILVGLVVGPLITAVPLGQYFTDSTLFRFLFGNASLVFMQYTLPGVFETTPYPAIVGSIWTLFYEVVCYGGVFVLGLLGLLNRRWIATTILTSMLAVIYLADLAQLDLYFRLENLKYLAPPFIFGMLACLWRDRLPLAWWLLPLTAILPVLAHGTAAYALSLCLALTYWTLWLGFVPGGAIRIFNRLGDYSYGIYVYAFPVQGLAVYLMGDQSPALNMLYALPPTVLLGVLSWHLIEKPAMAHKAQMVGLITSMQSWPKRRYGLR